MPSARYRLLSRRTGELRNFLLPKHFDPTGSYSPRVHERARAFRLLVHAEFEAFIEDRVADIVNARFDDWNRTRKTTRCLVSLVAYHEGTTTRNEPTSLLLPPQKESPRIDKRIESARNWLVAYAKSQNHGVKEENLLKLLMPLGLEAHEFDLTWLATITSWATGRGAYAHQSGTKIKTLADPQDELKTAQLLLKGFKKVDGDVEKL